MMQPIGITARAVVAAMGAGSAAILCALRNSCSGLRPNDFAGAGWIGRVAGLEEHHLPPALTRFDCRNNRLADMALQTDRFTDAVAAAVARYGAGRIAVVLGTSTSGVLSCEQAYAAREPGGALPASFDYGHTHDMFSAARYVRAALGLHGPALVVSTACASSARSFIDAYHLMQAGLCDAAVVGGVDTLCRLTLEGFAALDLISPTPCRPCAAGRTGISIGEAAGFALLERRDAPFSLLGYGATSDGYHMSSPHPEGAGAVAAMQGALDGAGLAAPAVDYVALHGTGTRANDSMEDRAVAAVFGDAMPCSSTKGWSGHTLGACGILAVDIAGSCIDHGFLPACLGVEAADPTFRSDVLTSNQHRAVRRIMLNAFGFGGINCSLLVGAPP